MELDTKHIVVLIVDDNEMNLELMQNILEYVDYKVHRATNGSDALKKINQVQPDIVLLDISMPHMDGYEVCRHIKANPDTAEIPVIFISALDETNAIIKGFDAGAVDYISKPFRYREVLARVQTQVSLVHAKREINQMRQRERQQYENLDNLRRQFIGSATHDLKNPLFVISGYADMLMLTDDITQNKQLTDFVKSIQHSVTKMSQLVHDILDLLQLETDIGLIKQTVDLGEFLDRVIVDHAMQAEKKQISLSLNLPNESVSILMDYQRMTRVLDNLLSNAIKYTHENGQVKLLGRVTGDQAIIEVIDTGLGIPPEQIETIFKPFTRVYTPDHMKQEGTGLGLSIVSTLVEQHNGTIEVESEFGNGSCFRISLPIEPNADMQ